MSALDVWLGRREPAPPVRLAAALRRVWEAHEAAGDAEDRGEDAAQAPAEELAGAARERLERALARPGRARQSAYHLLEADALFTYACEAALERRDVSATLRRILTVATG